MEKIKKISCYFKNFMHSKIFDDKELNDLKKSSVIIMHGNNFYKLPKESVNFKKLSLIKKQGFYNMTIKRSETLMKVASVYIEQLDFNNSEEYHINSYFCRKFKLNDENCHADWLNYGIVSIIMIDKSQLYTSLYTNLLTFQPNMPNGNRSKVILKGALPSSILKGNQ
ncbi:hypothetical protein RhiirA4_459546 [Rhizophagus irregularis]|uniref:Uncharacterized protein n=1 Tax=Rhizophagus irregularis TaxID=588596 RepID=A0A2I1GEK1_9GLOM|nr:hypothetical protein RhiirA4_459546 [Rhizophagus irregularis]